jgi:cullin 3
VLEDAIRDIFEGNARHLSFESLYRSSYNMVLHRRAEMLYNNLGAAVGARCDAVAGPVADKNDDEFLGAMHAVWEKHKVAMGMLRDILMYLDRTYVEQSKRLPVYALGLELFRDRVARHERIRRRLLQSMLERIGREREGERIDRSEAKSVADMYSEISHALYVEDFEAPFLDDSTRYYEGEAQKHIASDGCADYLRHASTRLEDEAARVERYLDARTGPKLRKRVQGALIGAHMGTLLEMEGTGLVAMLRGSHTADLRRMYSLFREVDGGAELMLAQVQAHLTEFGTALVNDPHKNSQPLEMVRGLLELKAKFDHIVAEAFTTQAAAAGAGAGGVAGGSGGGSGAGRQPRGAAAEARWTKTDKKFALAVSASFEVFMNRNSRTPEYLAIYLDKQLRSGLRDVDEAEAEARLDSALGLFKLLQEKDVFEKYYKQHLAKRLLGARSVSDDLEKSFVTKLKNECGSGYTGQMEAMFNDMRNSIDTNEAYREHVSQKRAAAATAEGGGGGGGGEAAAAERPELTVQVLTTGCWPVPAAAQGPQALPAQLAPCSEEFAAFYLAQHSGRKLSWRTTMGSADLRCTLGGKRRELVVSTQQMLLLLQFNLHQSRTAAVRRRRAASSSDFLRGWF